MPSTYTRIKRKVTIKSQRRERGKKMPVRLPPWMLRGDIWKESSLGVKASFSMLFQRGQYDSGMKKSQIISGTVCKHSSCLKYSRYTYPHNEFVRFPVKSIFSHTNQSCCFVSEGIWSICVPKKQLSRVFSPIDFFAFLHNLFLVFSALIT